MIERTSDPSRDVELPTLSTRVGRIAALLTGDRYPSGDRAVLKRMAPGTTPPLAFYRLWLRYLDDDLPSGGQTAAWALVVWGLASAAPGAHRPDRGLGRALAESGFSESRLERLFAADQDDTLLPLAADAVRFLAAKREVFNWVHLAGLLLTRAEVQREVVHRRIATDYYRYLPRPENKE
jgi:CRISPR system Cascade subunit CasB